MRILITGASGSGQSTLAEELSRRTGYQVLDGDDFLWIKSEPPYLRKREPAERSELLTTAIDGLSDVIVSGSIMGWGDALEHCFDVIVFLYVPTPIRMQRLIARETARFGKIDSEFEQWAAQYDVAQTEGRSLQKHEDWLTLQTCPVLRIEGSGSPREGADLVLAHLLKGKSPPGNAKALPSGFETIRLVARPYLLQDVMAFHQAVLETIDELRRWPDALPWVKEEQTPESSTRFFNQRGKRRLAGSELAYLLFDRTSDALIGAIGLHQIDWDTQSAVVGAWSRTSRRREGYMAEALTALLAQATIELGLRKIEAHTDEKNVQSRRVLERFGFVLRAPSGAHDAAGFCVYQFSS